MVTKKLVPPDGGYGWIVLCAFSLHHLIAIPINQMLGLIFKETFNDLEFTATDTSFIMNTNAAFGMFSGIFNGSLIKYLGYRKVSVLGAILTTSGVLLTAYANSFTYFIISYGLVTALGTGMGMSSYNFALNSYFFKKRVKAVGYALTISGFGPVLLPQLFSFLLKMYGTKGALMVVSGVAAHFFISALLLQPVRWHMREEIVEEKEEEENEKLLKKAKEDADNSNPTNKKTAAKKVISLDDDVPIGSLYSLHTPLDGSILSLHGGDYAAYHKDNEKSKKNTKTQDDSPIKEATSPKTGVFLNVNKQDGKETPPLKRIAKFLVEVFDLTLLKDPFFVNMMIGMSFAVFAEINFSVLTPFIMQDYGLNTQEIATFLSVQSIMDIIFRFVAPYLNDICKKPVRIMYMWCLGFMIISRFTLLFTTDYYILLGCSAFIGIARGFRTVYWVLVIPSSVPLERLPSALGLQYTCNSIFMAVGGPFLGFVRDITGSFEKSIIVINCVTFLCICMWSSEFIYKHYKAKKECAKCEDLEG